MKQAPRIVTSGEDKGRLYVRLPAKQKRRLQARLIMDGSSWTEFARVLAAAYVRGAAITVDGKPLVDLIQQAGNGSKDS